ITLEGFLTDNATPQFANGLGSFQWSIQTRNEKLAGNPWPVNPLPTDTVLNALFGTTPSGLPPAFDPRLSGVAKDASNLTDTNDTDLDLESAGFLQSQGTLTSTWLVGYGVNTTTSVGTTTFGLVANGRSI